MKDENNNANEKTVENKPIFMVELFWNGNTDDKSIDNWSLLDEHMSHDRSGGVYISFYKSKDDAENGYNRWLKRLKCKFDKDLNTCRTLLACGIDKDYPSVYSEFAFCTGIRLKNADDTVEFSDFFPKYHTVVETNVDKMSSLIDGFNDSMYENGVDVGNFDGPDLYDSDAKNLEA